MQMLKWAFAGVVLLATLPVWAQDSSDGTAQSGGAEAAGMDLDAVDVAEETAAGPPAEVPQVQLPAGKADDDWIRVIQRKPFLRKGRVELAPIGGVSINDELAQHVLVGAGSNYYLSENLSLGLDAIFSAGTETPLFDKLINDYELVADRVILQTYIGPHVGYVPIYGKFALFNRWVVYWDAYLQIGGGYVRTDIPASDSGGAMGAVGQRFYLNRWLTLYWDLRDYLYFARFGDDNDRFNQTMTISGGASFFVPFDFRYEE